MLVSALVLMAMVRMERWDMPLKGGYRLLYLEHKGISDEDPAPNISCHLKKNIRDTDRREK